MLPGEDGFLTTHEIMDEMGRTLKRTLKRLRELKEIGELEVRAVKRINLADRISLVPSYRLKPSQAEELTVEADINS